MFWDTPYFRQLLNRSPYGVAFAGAILMLVWPDGKALAIPIVLVWSCAAWGAVHFLQKRPVLEPQSPPAWEREANLPDAVSFALQHPFPRMSLALLTLFLALTSIGWPEAERTLPLSPLYLVRPLLVTAAVAWWIGTAGMDYIIMMRDTTDAPTPE